MANKAKANRPKLVPLKIQAQNEIIAARHAIEERTRYSPTRRRIAYGKLSSAQGQYRDGNYAQAINTARDAALTTQI
jgi:hypothetical protein